MTMANQAQLQLVFLICISMLPNLLLAFTDKKEGAYDVIVVGAGAGGCPLTQTLIEGGKKVLLVERGGERGPETYNVMTTDEAVLGDCGETYSSEGARVTTGNCIGGATSINGGVYITEEPEWLIAEIVKLTDEEFFDKPTIESAFAWNTERVAPEPTQETPGSGSELYVSEFSRALLASEPAIDTENLDPGQSFIPPAGTVFRTHSIFEPVTGFRRSADTLLDRSNEKLEVRTFAEVERILFQGDQGLPNWIMEQNLKDQEEEENLLPLQSNIARCVQFVNDEVACVRRGGRIYISAGTFLTPPILIRSGIGPNGDRVVNPHVGQHLSDKVAFLEVINFDSDNFDMSGEITFGNIAAVFQKDVGTMGEKRTLVSEPSSSGIMGTVLRAAAITGIFFPRSLRDTKINIPANEYFKFCAMESSVLNPICQTLLLVAEAGCLDQVGYNIMLVSDPTSEGNITVTKHGVEVNANYLSSKEDIEGLGAFGRSSFNTFASMRGPSAPQQPCDSKKKDSSCALSSCPDILSLLNEVLASTMEKLYPKRAGDLSYLKDPPPSAVYPHFIEWGINQGMNNYELGKLMSTYNTGSHHMGGTARIGDVIDTKFQVKGTSGLYVVDGSALPKTTRVNPMATIMGLGRLAGMSALLEDF